MSTLRSFVTKGFGQYARDNHHYVQAVRVGNTIKCAGQGGWDTRNENIDMKNLIRPDLGDEIDHAFANADHILKAAGGKGFSQVYKVVTYSTDITSQTPHIVRNLKKWMPNHAPIWTELGVKELGVPEMNFEIDVEAYDPEGAKSLS